MVLVGQLSVSHGSNARCWLYRRSGVVAMSDRHLTETDWWHDLMHGILGPRNGGARIIVDSEDASTGVGKTSLAVYVAELLAKAFGYQIEENDLTLSGDQYLQRWRDHPGAEQPSVLILDELGGAGAGNARKPDAPTERRPLERLAIDAEETNREHCHAPPLEQGR